jgi:hypothetical protein
MGMPKSINTLERQIDAKIKSLGEAGRFMSGSLVQKRWRCARPDCICNRTGKLHTAHAVTRKVKGKTKTVHVPVAMVEEVRGWTREYKRIQKLMKEIDALAEQVIRLQVPVARAASRRERSLGSTAPSSSES